MSVRNRVRIALAIWATLALIIGVAHSQVPSFGFPPGMFQNRAALDGTPPSFSGPGDIVSGATAFWGAQAYTAAYASGLGNAFNVCPPGDVPSCGDLKFDATGSVVNSAIGGSLCSVITCTIKIAYDHTGNGNGMVQTTEANRPTISFSCQNGRACMVFSGAKFMSVVNFNSSTNIAQPWTISSVYNDGGSQTLGGGIFAVNSAGSRGLYSNDGANTIECYAGTGVIVSATNGTWQAAACVANGASSDMNLNGTASTGNAGTNNIPNAAVFIGQDTGAGGSQYTGKIGTVGVWASAFSAGNSSAVSANYHTFWGF